MTSITQVNGISGNGRTYKLLDAVQQHQREEVFFSSLSDGQLQFLRDLLQQDLTAKRVQLAIWNREDEAAKK